MASYKSFTHVVRLGKPEVEGILNGRVWVFSKVDGTNASIFSDGLTVRYGSRKREITPEKDNAGFANWASKSDKMADLRQFVLDNPQYIVYGEWLSGQDGAKFCGTIKRYIEGGFHIFAIFDIERGDYLPYEEYAELMEGVYDKVIPPIAVFDNPSEDDIISVLDKCGYDLPQDDVGEGIVIYNYGWRDPWGNIQIAKIVRKEFREQKGQKSAAKKAREAGAIEQSIVEDYITSADIEKAQQKVLIKFDADTWVNDNKFIGTLIQFVYKDLIEEEMPELLLSKKGYKTATINFSVLSRLAANKVRDYLNL